MLPWEDQAKFLKFWQLMAWTDALLVEIIFFLPIWWISYFVRKKGVDKPNMLFFFFFLGGGGREGGGGEEEGRGRPPAEWNKACCQLIAEIPLRHVSLSRVPFWHFSTPPHPKKKQLKGTEEFRLSNPSKNSAERGVSHLSFFFALRCARARKKKEEEEEEEEGDGVLGSTAMKSD